MVGVDSASGGGSDSTDLPGDISYDIQSHADEPKCLTKSAGTVTRAHVTKSRDAKSIADVESDISTRASRRDVNQGKWGG